MGVSDSQKPLPMLFPQLDRLLRLPSSRPLSSPSSSGATRLLTKQFFQLLKKEKQQQHQVQPVHGPDHDLHGGRVGQFGGHCNVSYRSIISHLADTTQTTRDPVWQEFLQTS